MTKTPLFQRFLALLELKNSTFANLEILYIAVFIEVQSDSKNRRIQTTFRCWYRMLTLLDANWFLVCFAGVCAFICHPLALLTAFSIVSFLFICLFLFLSIFEGDVSYSEIFYTAQLPALPTTLACFRCFSSQTQSPTLALFSRHHQHLPLFP